ncbi:SCP extracellular protein [Phytophthora nicotianae]|uniref:SCP extracellular protein n=1 Tax=Phytophthora nicotianae TaxID=4792 RepID=A0A0W8DC38_PHYNI|nr:SCP extracellular protein [Phytophthora nicotianae]
MFNSKVFALSAAAVAMAAGSSSAFQIGSQGRVMWKNNCDYLGSDLYSVPGIPDVCGDICADDSKCTHWSWTYFNGGTCWLKNGKTATTSTYWGGGCGYASQASGSTSYDNGLTSAETSEMLASINSYRAQYGLAALTIDARLVAAAYVHSKDQAAQCTMAHEGSDGSDPWDRMEDQGYEWTVAAENVAAGQTSVEAVMTSWWNSAGHRANILKDDVTNVGFALASNSACSEYATYWTQDFGAQ